jgi:hypothetical protein
VKKIVSFSLFLILILSSCNLPTVATAPPPTQANPKDLIATMVAATVIAQPSAIVVATQAVPATLTQPNTTEQAPAPTGTPALTATAAAPSETSAPVASPTSNDFASSLGQPTWKDTFSDSGGFFVKGTNSYEDDHTRIAIENGMMTLTSFGTPPNWLGWRLANPTIKNFYLETSFVTHNCSGADRYGMIFRAPDFDSGFGFYLAFSCDGRYRLERMDDAGLAFVTPWSTSSAISAGSEQNNRMGVLATDSTYSIYINGVKQIEVNDAHFQEAGHFGPFIAYAQNPNFSIDLKSITYWIMP